MTVDPNRLGTARPKIEPETLDGDSAVLTIAGYFEDEVDDPTADGGKRPSAYLTCEETGDLVLWLNKTTLTAIVHYYGSDDKQWIGQLVPVEHVTGTAFKKPFDKVAVCPLEAWPEYIEGLEPPEPAPKPQRKKTARKKSTNGRKRTKRGKR